jgi:hypothetical protein
MLEGWISYSYPRVRLTAAGTGGDEALLGLLGGDPDGLRACHRGDQLRGLRHVLAVCDHRGDVPERLLAKRLAGAFQVGELLGAEDQADPGGAGAAEEPCDVLGGHGGELVDHHDRRHGVALLPCDEGDRVADDRRGQHPRQQRPAIGVETKVDDRPISDGAVNVEHILAGRVEPPARVGLREDRQTVTHP